MTARLAIDGQVVIVPEGLTVLQAARRHGIEIPTLCDYPALPPSGSCRMCIVEIEGRRGFPTACTTPAEDGLVVRTQTPDLLAMRLELLQMLCAEHPSTCLFCTEDGLCADCMLTLRKASATTGCRSCPKDGQCELQSLARRLGLKALQYPIRYRSLPVQRGDPFIDRDNNLCVLCGRCVRACAARHDHETLVFLQRGARVQVGTAFGGSLLDAGCSFCGACLDACPTGALTEKTRKWDGAPDQETLTTCPLCSLGCELRLLSRGETLSGALPAGEDPLCVHGRFGLPELVNHPSRLRRPQALAGDYPQALAWSEAAHRAAERLAACPPEQFELRISAGCSNEDFYVAQKFTRQVIGSTRIQTVARRPLAPDPLAAPWAVARSVEPDGNGLWRSAFSAAPGVALAIGLDGQYAQAGVASRLLGWRREGTRLITIYPRPHPLASLADVWLKPEAGGELELLETLAALAGPEAPTAPNAAFGRAIALLRAPGPRVVLLGPALLEHPGNPAVQAAALRLAERLGGSVLALAAQGNLAGSLWMGAYPEWLAGLRPAAPHARPGPAEVLYLFGAPLPDPAERPGFVIYQHLYPPEGAQPDLCLPMAAFTETDGSLVDAANRVRSLRPAARPPGEARPGWQILCQVARALGAPGFDFDCAEEVQAEIGRNVPGFAAGSRLAGPTLAEFAFLEQAGAGWTPGTETFLGLPLSRYVEGLRFLRYATTDEPSLERDL